MKNIQDLHPADYLEILRKRFLLILLPCLLLGPVGILVTRKIPDVYLSQTLILVEPPKIPVEYVRTSAEDSITTRLSTITQQIMSRTRLEKIILENDLYPDLRKKISNGCRG